MNYFGPISAEVIGLFSFFSAAFCILFLLKHFGMVGLACYQTICVAAAQLQTVKKGLYALCPDPVALGTVLFSSTWLVSDLMTEYFGAKAAHKVVILSFLTTFIWTVFLGLAVAVPPISGDGGHQALSFLMTPSFSVFFASITSYIVSQHLDVWIFAALRKKTGPQGLWLRSTCASGVSAIVDTILFSFLAWKVFALDPIPSIMIWRSYILGTLIFRCFCTLGNVGVMYAARQFCTSSSVVSF